MFLILTQVTRRLCECTFLSVYSDARMNVVHYIFGYSFYFGVGLSVIAEAPGFTGKGGSKVLSGHQVKLVSGPSKWPLSWNAVNNLFPLCCTCDRVGLTDVYFGADFLKWYHFVGVAIFLVASYVQYQSHTILANLRKDNRGDLLSSVRLRDVLMF